MFKEIIEFIKKFKSSFPHRQINIITKEEPVASKPQAFKLDLDLTEPPVKKNDETKSN